MTKKPTDADMGLLEEQIGLALQDRQENAKQTCLTEHEKVAAEKQLKAWQSIAEDFSRLQHLRKERTGNEPSDAERTLYHQIQMDIKLASRS